MVTGGGAERIRHAKTKFDMGLDRVSGGSDCSDLNYAHENRTIPICLPVRVASGTDHGWDVNPTRPTRISCDQSGLSAAALPAALMWACALSAGNDSPPVTRAPFSYIISSI